MHDQIRNRLEDYLGGRLPSGTVLEFHQHLAACEPCRKEVAAFETHAALIRTLRTPSEDIAPAPGFYARVMDRIDEQRGVSLWSVFLQPIFARRVMYVTLTLFLLLGSSLLWTGESHDVLANDANPVGVMAGYGPHVEAAANPDMEKEYAMETVLNPQQSPAPSNVSE
jgi:anti-sigma factor RsiW